MAKQLELNFNKKSDTLKEIEKEIPEYKKQGFKTKDEWVRACNFDREWKYMYEHIKATRGKK